jgi:anti-sigma-K factor RskA
LTNGSHIREEDLELLALGALPEKEAAEARAHLAGCNECAGKLAEARGVAALMAFAVEQEMPSSAVKEKLMARIAAEQGTAAGTVPARERRMEREEAKTPWWTWVLVPASLALAAVCLLLSWQNRKLALELQTARHAASEFHKERERAEEMVAVLAAPDTMTVKLAGTSDAAQASGVVKYNPRTGTVLYSASNLPPLPAGKVYQMWLVPTNGAPISAGLCTPNAMPEQWLWTAQVPPKTEAKAFAVTIEPAGGVPAPTGPKVLLGAS